MVVLLYLVFVCSNFLLIKSEDTGDVTINVIASGNCTLNRDYTFTDGQNVSLMVKSPMHINYGWWTLITSTGSQKLSSELITTKGELDKPEPIVHTSVINRSMEGTWEFKFYYYRNNENMKKVIRYNDGSTYVESVCSTNVKIEPKPTAASQVQGPDNKFLIIACAVGAILVAIIIGQTAYILYLLAKARRLITLNTHNNLSKKTEPVPNDTARYCSNPGKKMMIAADPVDEGNRDSVIYEAPNIEIPGNTRMPMQPPQPPAITTMPRTPRPDHNMKIGPQAMLASALNSPARSPMPDNYPPTFQRPKLEREVSVANRPPLPLPGKGHPYAGHPQPGHSQPGHPHNNTFHEVYEEMETEENTYEPPPVINTMPHRLPMPPKKVPTGNLLDVKENTLKMRQGNKPAVTQKPQQSRPNVMAANEFEQALRRRNNDTMPKSNSGHMTPMQQELARRRPNGDSQTNELEEALRRRNNVMPVPIVSIPDHSSRGSPKPRPPPALHTKPRGPPVPQPVQEEIYYNENQASSDEEWTYEPLKPLNSYDANIYNV